MRTEQEIAHRHSRATIPGQTSLIRNPNLLDELKAKRDAHNEIAVEELRKDPPNYEIVNPNQSLATLYHDAITTIENLVKQNGSLVETLKHRVIVALSEAKAPAWVPTHRHYKGTLYRVTGVRYDADHEELIEMVEYDDERGGKFVLTRRRWESTLDSGRPRYEYLYGGSSKAIEEKAPERPSRERPTIEAIERAAAERFKRTGMDRLAALDEIAISFGFTGYVDAERQLRGSSEPLDWSPVKPKAD